MSDDLTIHPVSRPFAATMAPPGSRARRTARSCWPRLADGVSTLSNVLFADDTLVMLDGLARLGFEVNVDRGANVARVHAGGAIPAAGAGPLLRQQRHDDPLPRRRLRGAGRGTFTLDGVPRMRQRPIRELADLLKNLGVRTTYGACRGFPPLRVLADGFPGGFARFGGSQSSQYLSAVLQVAAYARNEVHVLLDGPQTSWPYVAMTMRFMDEFHVTPELIRDPASGVPRRIVIPKRLPRDRLPDRARRDNATYFLAACTSTGGDGDDRGTRQAEPAGGRGVRRRAAPDGRRPRVRQGLHHGHRHRPPRGDRHRPGEHARHRPDAGGRRAVRRRPDDDPRAARCA